MYAVSTIPIILRSTNHRLCKLLIPANISTLFQRCLLVDTTSRRGAMSNQCWNNVLYFKVGICNVERRWINAVYINVDIYNVIQPRNKFVIFNVDMNNVVKFWNNVKMTISKKNKANHFKQNTRNLKF